MEIELKFPIRELLRGAQAGACSQPHISELHRVSFAIARQLVHRKVAAGALRLDLIGLCESDVINDCIADLFARNGSNELIEFRKFFDYQHINIDDEPDEMLFVHLRRLVFTIVDDNIVRLYREIDPALGKIIRNIKIAVGNSSLFRLIVRFDELSLVPVVPTSLLPQYPTIADEDLQTEVFSILSKEKEIPCILRKLASVMQSWETYQRRVPLLSLAVAIKLGYERFGFIEHEDEVVTFQPNLAYIDIEAAIHEVCREIDREMRCRYVGSGKVDVDLFSGYIRAVETFLLSELFDGQAGGKLSYYECLCQHVLGLTKDEYLHHHRSIIEYLGKLAKQRVKERLQVYDSTRRDFL